MRITAAVMKVLSPGSYGLPENETSKQVLVKQHCIAVSTNAAQKLYIQISKISYYKALFALLRADGYQQNTG